jgi:hypothetical protein
VPPIPDEQRSPFPRGSRPRLRSRQSEGSSQDVPDEMVPDREVRHEFGDVSPMCLWRWDRDEALAALGWPPPVKIRKRNFRPRKALEDFKAALQRQALESRSSRRR